MCGEQWALRALFDFSAGSSPRVRGTVLLGLHEPLDVGIIPACAGNSSSSQDLTLSSRDHPRACGEQATCRWKSQSRMGSSPRVRGTGLHLHQARQGPGIIPARAGNSLQVMRHGGINRDHPRACGEQEFSSIVSNKGKGSSPRVRGTELMADLDDAVLGIIPARAGNRRRSGCGGRSGWDHPRACGEQTKYWALR